MPKGCPLSETQRQSIYNMHCDGESNEDIAAAFGIAAGSVRHIVRRFQASREQGGDGQMAQRSMVVAGDKANGRLISTESHKYEGTCIVGGRSKKRVFTASNVRAATEMWEKWCDDQRAEEEFVARIERRESLAEPVEEAVDPEITDEQARPEDIEEMDERSVQNIVEYSKHMYLIFTNGPTPKFYGIYDDEDNALAEVDRLNDVAAFLGNGSMFEVDQVVCRDCCVGR